MGIWSLNKKGEDIATSNVIPIIIGLFVIAIIAMVIIAFWDQIGEESFPIVQDFEEAINITQHAAQEPLAGDEAQLSGSFELFIASFNNCVEHLDPQCGCPLTTTEIPEGSSLGVINDIEENKLKFITYSATDVPKESYAQESIKLGLLYYDENTKDLECVFPNASKISASEDKDKDYDIAESQWAVTLDNVNYYDFLTNLKLGNSKDESTVKNQFTVSFFEDEHVLVVEHNVKTLDFVPSHITLNYYDSDPVDFAFFESGNRWEYKTQMNYYHTRNIIYNGNRFPDSANDIYDQLAEMNEEEGIEYFTTLKEERSALLNEDGTFPTDYNIPTLIKLDNFHFCLATELIADEINLDNIDFAIKPIKINKEDNDYYFEDYPYFYLIEQEYCAS